MPNFFMKGENFKVCTRSDRDKVSFVFTRGHCHSFALALHELTDWPLVGLYDWSDGDMAGHVACKAPDGSIVDINGPGAERRYPSGRVEDITEGDLREWMQAWEDGRVGYVPSNVEGARQFARKVLREKFGVAA